MSRWLSIPSAGGRDDAECDASCCGSLGTWPRPKETVLYDGLIGATVCRGGLLRVLRTNEAYMKHYREPATVLALAPPFDVPFNVPFDVPLLLRRDERSASEGLCAANCPCLPLG